MTSHLILKAINEESLLILLSLFTRKEEAWSSEQNSTLLICNTPLPGAVEKVTMMGENTTGKALRLCWWKSSKIANDRGKEFLFQPQQHINGKISRV
ncbi:hypothetical protein HYE13_00905 [Mycoplasmopsis bovis]|nr:hypothetical protein [Mycoplasmopsis bovis]QQH25963.1 hypothetical protein HYE13_00905 [Mycoplasmopsis bovis]